MLLGDARAGKLADNLTAFGRSLRRAGVPVDASRMALAQQALSFIDLGQRGDVRAALEAVLVSREGDRAVFGELFEAFFKNPDVAQKLLSQMLPSSEGKTEPMQRRARVREALSPQKAFAQTTKRPDKPEEIRFDATMTASAAQRLKHADFNQLSAAEYALVLQTVQQIPLDVPCFRSRRHVAGLRGARLDGARSLARAARTGGDCLVLPRRTQTKQSLPLLVLVDVSGSMERYSRMLLAFLHAATQRAARSRTRGSRDVFSFGNRLTDLNPAFALGDCDEMLAKASVLIEDFAGGTQLGESLAMLRAQHARRLVGRRTCVLLVSDGLDTGEPEVLRHELRALKRRIGRLVWLNPLMRFDGYTPSARAATVLHEQCDAMLAVHNIESLQMLARSLARALQSPRGP